MASLACRTPSGGGVQAANWDCRIDVDAEQAVEAKLPERVEPTLRVADAKQILTGAVAEDFGTARVSAGLQLVGDGSITGWLYGLNAMQSAELGLEDLCCGMAAADSSGDDGERACDQPRSEDDEEEPPYGRELVGVP
jgi:hypothetical protein